MIVILAIVLMVLVDQAIKYWALTDLSAQGTIPLLDGVFHLTYVENRGAAFGILQDQRWLFLLMTPVILAVTGLSAAQKLYSYADWAIVVIPDCSRGSRQFD